MLEQQISDLERRMGVVEKDQKVGLDALHRIELNIAQLTGAVRVLQWGLPVAVTIGGTVIAVIVAITRNQP